MAAFFAGVNNIDHSFDASKDESFKQRICNSLQRLPKTLGNSILRTVYAGNPTESEGSTETGSTAGKSMRNEDEKMGAESNLTGPEERPGVSNGLDSPQNSQDIMGEAVTLHEIVSAEVRSRGGFPPPNPLDANQRN